MFERFTLFLGRLSARFLTKPLKHYKPFAVSGTDTLNAVLKPADVLLVEGDQRFSKIVKYVTQSTWSHAALYVGTAFSGQLNTDEPMLIEADLADGVIAVPLSKYENFNTRVCRPVSLSETECAEVARFAVDRIGHQYDLKNIIDLLQYMLLTPLFASRQRQQLALGSREPDRVICSALIAQAFYNAGYPVLPDVFEDNESQKILHRHHSLYVPRDFDLSPYFQVVKPTLETGFDHKELLLRQ